MRHSDTASYPGLASKHGQQNTPTLNPGEKSLPAGWDFRRRGPRTAPLLLLNRCKLDGTHIKTDKVEGAEAGNRLAQKVARYIELDMWS